MQAPSGEKATPQTGPVWLEPGEHFARHRIPQPRLGVPGTGHNAGGAVRREGDRPDRARVALKRGDRFFRGRVPQPRRGVPGTGQDAGAVGVERYGLTNLVWPSSAATTLPVAASHSRAVASPEPVRTREPSGEKATLGTSPVWKA
jgi:hypothetical protein